MKLFKYRSYSEFLIQEICGSDIYFSDPRCFNDPLDCSPTVINDLPLKELEKLCLHMISENNSIEKASKLLQDFKSYANEFCTNKQDYLNSYTFQLKSEVENQLNKKMKTKGVLSLSSKNNSPLMWSHYANEHKGVCLEFDMNTNIGTPPVKIDYNSPRSIDASIIFNSMFNKSEEALKTIENKYFYTKSNEWNYESEWRIISDRTGVQCVPFHLTAVYFGMRCDYYIKASIIKILKDKHPSVDFYEIYPDTSSFELHARSLEPNEYHIPRPSAAIVFANAQ